MNPCIYASRAAKQAEYRAGKKLDMSCEEYRAAIAAGKITPPVPTHTNRGWYGSEIHAGSRYNEKPTITSPVPQVQKQPVTPPEPVTKPIAVKPTYCNRDHHHNANCYSPEGMTVDWLERRPATEQEFNQDVVKRI